jgi:hypothetical protein
MKLADDPRIKALKELIQREKDHKELLALAVELKQILAETQNRRKAG